MLVKLGQVDSQFASYTAEKGGGSSPVMIHNIIASMVNSEKYNETVRREAAVGCIMGQVLETI
jgi:hypothetical protein